MRRSLLFVAAVVLVGVLGVWLFTQKTLSPPEIQSRKAFLDAEWGASAAEVERADKVKLGVSTSPKKFYTVKAGIDPTRYKSLEVQQADFLSRPATVTYIFFDNRLFSYTVFIQDTDAETLDRQMREYLIRRFGEGYSELEDDSPLKMIWHGRELIVNYWLMETVSLRPKASAGFGVVDNATEAMIKA